MESRWYFAIGAILAALAVAASAYGSHGIKGQVDQQRLQDFETAARNQMVHAIGLLLVGLVGRGKSASWCVNVAGAAFLVGIMLFCGGLYGYAISNDRDYLRFAPIGGTLFMIGWIALAVAGWKSSSRATRADDS